MTPLRTLSILTSSLALAAAGAVLLAPAGRADTLSVTNVTPAVAAAQLQSRYGISVVFRSPVVGRVVSFSADSPDTPAGRVQAVNDLANALGMDFQKVFVVSKADPGATPPEVALDTDAPVVFPALTTPARDAITLVAGVDGALAQVSGKVTGSVTFPSRRMSVRTAAAAIARQTGTVWKAYYGIFNPADAPARLRGTVVDRTNGGQPITALPGITFRNAPRAPVASAAPALPVVPGAAASPFGPTPPLQDGPVVSSVPSTAAVFDNGFSPFGYSPFGYGFNPYGGFGYQSPDGGAAYPGYVYTPGAGIDPAYPGYNAPGYFGPGINVTTVGGY